MKRFLSLACAAFLFSSPVFAQSDAPPVVMELFTSQGCAYCPPADTLLDQASKQDGIIALSCHVDYFRVRENSLGKNICTKRQQIYTQQLGKRSRYTPQLVINGRKDMIGYESDKVSAALLKARFQNVQPVGIVPNAAGYTVSLPQTAPQTAQVLLIVFDTPHRMAITDGNNLGKTVTYTNVVSRIEDAGAWDGAAMTLDLNPRLGANDAGFAILAQDTRTGAILAAGQIRR